MTNNEPEDPKDDEPDFWEQLYRQLREHPRAIWSVIILLTGISIYYSKKLSVDTDLKRLLPDSYKSVQVLNKIIKNFGASGDVAVLIESPDWNLSVKFAEELTKSFEAHDAVKYVEFKRPSEFFRKNRLLYLSEPDLDKLRDKIRAKIKKEKVRANPLFVDLSTDEENQAEEETDELQTLQQKYSEYNVYPYFQDPNSRYLAIRAFPSISQLSIKEAKRVYNDLVRTTQDLSAKEEYAGKVVTNFGGNIRNRITEYDTIMRDVGSSGWITLVLVVALLWLYFRNPIWVILNCFCFPMAIAWTFGIVYGVYGSLNILTVFLVMVLFGLGIDYGTHMIARYMENRHKGMNVDDAILGMLRHSGRSSCTAAFATALAFLVLLFTDFRGFSEFGFITGVGIPLSLGATLVCLPLLILFLEKHCGKWLSYKLSFSDFERFKGRRFPMARGIVIGSVVFAILGLLLLTNINFEYDFTRLRAQQPDPPELSEKWTSIFKRSSSPAYILTDSKEEAKLVTETLRKHAEQDKDTPTIDVVRSALDLVPTNQVPKIEILQEIHEILTDTVISRVKSKKDRELLAELKYSAAVDQILTFDKLPEDLVRPFRSQEGTLSYFTLIFPSVQLRDGRNTLLFADDVAQVKTKSKTFYSSSQAIIFAEMLRLMVNDGALALGLTFLLVFTIVWIDFRNFKQALVAVGPLIIGILLLIIYMRIFGMKINIYNMVAIPSLIGMGMDFCVHLTHRYLENPHSGPLYSTLMTGTPVTYAAMTTVVGYFGLVFADHPGLNSLGVVSCVGLCLVLLAALLSLPAFLQLFGKKL